MDWKLELVAIPVSDVDRAKAFYAEQAGFVVDHDHQVSDDLRFVQFTPPGSACSIAIGTGVTDAPPGSVKGMQMVVSDVRTARAELVERGVEASEVRSSRGAPSRSSRTPTGTPGRYRSSRPAQPRNSPCRCSGVRSSRTCFAAALLCCAATRLPHSPSASAGRPPRSGSSCASA